MNKAAKKSKMPELKFYQRLILNQYMWRIFGAGKLDELSTGIKRPHCEEIDEEQRTGFLKFWLHEYPQTKRRVTNEQLSLYDANIVRHLKKINEKRSIPIRLKYFQWLSLIFVEYYLDAYFNRRDELLNGLNNELDIFASQNAAEYNNAKLPPYMETDLNKIALWNATGSGKTLLMHINYLQHLHYSKLQAGASFILLTPKEGLSTQHIDEFSISGIDAAIYDKNESRMYSNENRIIVLENTKLEEKDGDKTVSVRRFGSENIVFVDEGHRGSSSGKEGKWQKFRDELCYNGFSFEYSATFGQAADSTNDKELADRYAKCIIFDYSYKFFYKDGYGKDYNILNLKEEGDGTNRRMYLTAGLLSFYQQKKIFTEKASEFSEFNIENPLFVFVGSSVNVVRKEQGRDVSDVLDILLFFKNFLDDKSVAIKDITSLLSGTTGFDVFAGTFPYLIEKGLSSEEFYSDILKTVFNADTAGAVFHIENLKGVSGEIQLRFGDNSPFGVINVGDDSNLLKLCAANGFDTTSISFSGSLFQGITKPNSTINILIGAKKFTEGWNCWRVSTMGLMNVGKSEGSEIIQLFGRGIRLKGCGISLKRSAEWIKDNASTVLPKYIKLLETLNVFGVCADYMKQFKEFLDREDVNSKIVTIILPVIKNLPNRKLKIIRLKDGVSFQKDAPKPELEHLSKEIEVTLDMYANVQFTSSGTIPLVVAGKEENKIPKGIISLFDIDALWFEIVRYKKEKGKNNIVVSRKSIQKLLEMDDWYKLLIPQNELAISSYDDVKRFEKIVLILLKKYLDRYYYIKQNNWESKIVGYEYVDLTDENFPTEYAVTTADEQFKIWLTQIEAALKDCKKKGKFSLPSNSKLFPLEILNCTPHLYNPLIYQAKDGVQIEVSPVALNESEKHYVDKLHEYISKEENKDLETYLLRNKSKVGVGFFDESGFFPDFILWIIKNEKQYITFIDPKGMRNEGFESGKVNLYKEIKNIQNKLCDSSVILNSFILSFTKYSEMPEYNIPITEWNKKNVLFMKDQNNCIEIFFDKIMSDIP